jgi:hypothetical protein
MPLSVAASSSEKSTRVVASGHSDVPKKRIPKR